ncbi:MAG: catecholate siderophore receptor Fiu [Gammaproteobacteria bacterium]
MNYIKARKYSPLPRPALATATLITGLALSLPGVAQQASDGGAKGGSTALPKITVEEGAPETVLQVESPKFTQPLQDTPQTIQIIGAGLFTEQGATTLTEALRNTPGVGAFYLGENGSTSTGDTVYMRGFDSSSSIFVDGVRDLGSISHDIFNVEQIEVEKGPAGTDNGRSAPTGAINLVTKQPFMRDAVGGEVSGGVDGQKRATADWNQTLGGSQGNALRLNAVWQDSDVAGRDHIENKRWGVAPSVAFGLDTSTHYFLDLLYVKQDNIPDGGVSTIGLPGYQSPDPARPFIASAATADPDNFYGTKSDHDDVTAKMATFKIEHEFSEKLSLTNTARWGSNKQDYLLTSFMASAANLITPNPTNPATWTVARSNPTFKDQENTILTDQLALRVDFNTGAVVHNVSTGVEFTREKLEASGVAATGGSAWPAANLYDPNWAVAGLTWAHNGANREGKTTTTSGYVFDTLKFGERFLVTGGIRLDDYKTEYDALAVCGSRGGPVCGTNPAGTVVPSVDLDTSDTLFNWKLGAVYKVVPDVSLYVNYAVSQQPPGGATFELSSAANSANNPAFDPQKAKTAEIGAKWNALDENLFVALSLFDTDVTNEIAMGDDGLYYQIGKKSVKGAELSVVGKITENWAISAGYSHLKTKVDRGALLAQDGSTVLTYTPDDSLTTWTTYRLPFKLTLGGGVRYSGELHRGTDGAVGTPAYADSYTVWDAVASYPVTEKVGLRLNAYNLFDKEYVAAINKSGYRYTPGTPRTFLLSADFRF